MQTSTAQVGRVIRIGRGWADVTVGHKLRRVSTPSGLLVRVGNHLQIVNDQGVAILPASERHGTVKLN